MEMYSVAGSIQVDPDVVTDEVMNQLEEDLAADNVETHVEDGSIHILIYDAMSYAEANEVDDVLIKFASQYALAPAALQTEMGGGGIVELFVGPEGFDAVEVSSDLDGLLSDRSDDEARKVAANAIESLLIAMASEASTWKTRVSGVPSA